MKQLTITIFTLLALLLLSTTGNSQFSIGIGSSVPYGSYSDNVNGGGASPGLLVLGGWTKEFQNDFGLATGIKFGFNPASSSQSNLDASQWSLLLLEAGIYYDVSEKFRLKGLLVRGGASTPEYTLGSIVAIESGSAGAFGLDIGAEYMINNIMIGANFMGFKPAFKFQTGFITESIDQSITLFSLSVSYQFN